MGNPVGAGVAVGLGKVGVGVGAWWGRRGGVVAGKGHGQGKAGSEVRYAKVNPEPTAR